MQKNSHYFKFNELKIYSNIQKIKFNLKNYNISKMNNANLRTLERNASGKLSYSPGHWKNYIATDLMRRPE